MSDLGQAVRDWLTIRLAGSAEEWIGSAPDWLLLAVAGVGLALIFVVLAWSLRRLVASSSAKRVSNKIYAFFVFVLTIGATVTFVTRGVAGFVSIVRIMDDPTSALDVLEPPAKQKDLDEIRREITKIKEVLARRNNRELDSDATKQQNKSIEDLLTEGSPQTDQAAQLLAAGDLKGAVETLEKQAKIDGADSAEKWRRLGALVLGTDSAKAREVYEEAFRLDSKDFWTCIQLAALRLEAGDFNGANEISAIAITLARTDHERIAAKNHRGYILLQAGDPHGANDLFEDALSLARGAVEQDPTQVRAKEDLFRSHINLGDALFRLKDPRAKGHYQAGLAIVKPVYDETPSSQALQRDLAITYERLGGSLREDGDLQGARANLQAAVELRKGVADKNPTNTDIQRNYCVSLILLGEIEAKSGNNESAAASFERGLNLIVEFRQRTASSSALEKEAKYASYQLRQARARKKPSSN